MKMEQNQELYAFTTTDDDEILTGDDCPVCGYPIVLEQGLEVCYRCGWYKGIEVIE